MQNILFSNIIINQSGYLGTRQPAPEAPRQTEQKLQLAKQARAERLECTLIRHAIYKTAHLYLNFESKY
jgi:hypothetical protein